MADLVVNVDQVATLREGRKTPYPDPVAAAALVELAGADGVAIHLREDRRHIKNRDVHIIRQIIQTKLTLAITPSKEMVAIALEVRPNLVTLVAKKREELTTEGGLDLSIHRDHIEDVIRTLHQGGISVSLSVSPDPDQIKMAHRIDADKVEIDTGTFCNADTLEKQKEAFQEIVNSAKIACKLKMGVNAGHGLDYKTVKYFQGLREIDEFSIGHSIIARAVMVGMDRAVREMVALIKEL